MPITTISINDNLHTPPIEDAPPFTVDVAVTLVLVLVAFPAPVAVTIVAVNVGGCLVTLADCVEDEPGDSSHARLLTGIPTTEAFGTQEPSERPS